MLPTQFGGFRRIPERIRIGEQPLDLRRPGECIAQQVAEAQRLALRRLGNGGRRRRGRALRLVLLAEPLHAASRVEQTLLARVERVAFGADVSADVGDRGTRLKLVPAGAMHSGGCVLGMDVGLH